METLKNVESLMLFSYCAPTATCRYYGMQNEMVIPEFQYVCRKVPVPVFLLYYLSDSHVTSQYKT